MICLDVYACHAASFSAVEPPFESLHRRLHASLLPLIHGLPLVAPDHFFAMALLLTFFICLKRFSASPSYMMPRCFARVFHVFADKRPCAPLMTMDSFFMSISMFDDAFLPLIEMLRRAICFRCRCVAIRCRRAERGARGFTLRRR